MDILAQVALQPLEAHGITDDQTAQRFLADIGLTAAFPPQESADGQSLSQCPTVELCGFDGLTTHFVIGHRFSGCGAGENGWLVQFVPRIAFAPGISTYDMLKGAARQYPGLRVLLRQAPGRN